MANLESNLARAAQPELVTIDGYMTVDATHVISFSFPTNTIDNAVRVNTGYFRLTFHENWKSLLYKHVTIETSGSQTALTFRPISNTVGAANTKHPTFDFAFLSGSTPTDMSGTVAFNVHLEMLGTAVR